MSLPARQTDSTLVLMLDRLDGIERRLDLLMDSRDKVVPLWVAKRDMAARLNVSVSWLEERVADGLPHRVIANKRVYNPATVESWLCNRGLIREVV